MLVLCVVRHHTGLGSQGADLSPYLLLWFLYLQLLCSSHSSWRGPILSGISMDLSLYLLLWSPVTLVSLCMVLFLTLMLVGTDSLGYRNKETLLEHCVAWGSVRKLVLRFQLKVSSNYKWSRYTSWIEYYMAITISCLTPAEQPPKSLGANAG